MWFSLSHEKSDELSLAFGTWVCYWQGKDRLFRVLIVEVDVFEDMKNMALNSQDTSWREIYAKYLLNVMMSQTILTVLGGLWTWNKFIAVLGKSYSKMEYLVLASFVTKLGTGSRIAKFNGERATIVVLLWNLKRGSMNWVCSGFVVILAGEMEPLRHHVKGCVEM